MIRYNWHRWDELTADLLYEILELRQDVFIVEQKCAYKDMDGYDRKGLHLTGRDEDGNLVAYLRLLPPGTKFAQPSIGRIVTSAKIRGTGVGRELTLEGIRKCRDLYPGSPIFLYAQVYAVDFYRKLGFRVIGKPFDEDGIMHVDMICEASTEQR